eukprot:3810019-Prymnesium_polylepis.1
MAVKSSPWAAALRAAAKLKSRNLHHGDNIDTQHRTLQGTAWRSDFVGVNNIFTSRHHHACAVWRARRRPGRWR